MQTDEHIQADEWIDRYLAGNLDGESLEKLKQWALASEERQRYVRSRVELWLSSGASGSHTPFDSDKAYERFLSRKAAQRPVAGRRVMRPWWKLAGRVAAVILIILLPLIGYWRGEQAIEQHFADIVVEAPLGARTKLNLPDGTQVWLNAGTRIVYSQGFGVSNRRLTIEGEGYFEVPHNQKIPFEINTREVDLRVLGTKFNFRNYPNDQEITVDLIEGKVVLHNDIKPMSELYLNPDEKMVMNRVTGEMKKSSTKASQSNVWINDELFFDEDSLEDIAKRLMRSYNVQIEVADSLRGRRFYGSFKVQGNSVENILDAIASTHQMRYRYDDGKYILY
ncbi:FecR domain-containing protein [uncultured Bacteroides sp.]|uniref:FecR family protein n=1 Tax=uncultured Bacteroides sp. TaxID=162156 RepID=UPI00260D7997|nr:FecR domain-containing protein [uncultured Bacteroides sp.]